jgi:hypothetical protein
MPLSDAVERTHLHTRAITLHGFQRADGLFDIDARLTDTKTYEFSNADRGEIKVGEPLHHMVARITVDDRMHIVAAEAVTEQGPYTICPGGAESFARLEGLTIGPGFLKLARERLGGTIGCTHLRELLQQIATTAHQTVAPIIRRRAAAAGAATGPGRMLNSCYAYASDGEAVRRRWPDFYTGPKVDAPPAQAG